MDNFCSEAFYILMEQWLFQELKTEVFGKAQNFEAVPGCGLKCTVAQVESLIKDGDLNSINSVNRRSSIDSFQVTIEGMVSDQGGIGETSTGT